MCQGASNNIPKNLLKFYGNYSSNCEQVWRPAQHVIRAKTKSVVFGGRHRSYSRWKLTEKSSDTEDLPLPYGYACTHRLPSTKSTTEMPTLGVGNKFSSFFFLITLVVLPETIIRLSFVIYTMLPSYQIVFYWKKLECKDVGHLFV